MRVSEITSHEDHLGLNSLDELVDYLNVLLLNECFVNRACFIEGHFEEVDMTRIDASGDSCPDCFTLSDESLHIQYSPAVSTA